MANFSIADQIRMNGLDLNSMLMQNMFGVSSSINSVQKTSSTNALAYAVKGDKKYDAEMDSDSDGTVTFNEYVNYISSHNLKKYNIPEKSTVIKNLFDTESGAGKTQILNYGKALSTYLLNSTILPQSIISKQA